MAFLPDDDDKLLQNGTQDQGALGGSPQALVGNTAVPSTVQSGAPGVSTAGVGAGGQGGWTNIQAYLNANKGNTESSKLVDGVGSRFEKERTDLKADATKVKGQATAEAEKTNIGKDAASQLVEQAAQAGRGSDPYNQNTSQLKGALSASYGGPTSYAYARNTQNEDYGTRMGKEGRDGFQGVMENLYRDATGGRITGGQLNLQRQLDLGEGTAEALQASRNKALQSFAGLNTDIDSEVAGANTFVGNEAKRFADQQGTLRNNLGSQQGQAQGTLQSLADTWNGSQDSLASNKADSGKVMFGAKKDVASQMYFDRNPYVTWRPGERAAFDKVDGGMPQKNVWNTIADILNQQKQIDVNAKPTSGEWRGDIEALNAGLAAHKDALRNQGYTVSSRNFETLADYRDWLNQNGFNSSDAYASGGYSAML